MEPRPTQADYRQLMSMARRCAFGALEPEDLAQEAALIALSQGRRLTDRGWLYGVMRNLAFAHYRATRRRERREARAGASAVTGCAGEPAALLPAGFVAALPDGLRLVLQLSLSGHTRAEIRHLLRLSDEALRQRLSQLRRRVVQSGLPMPDMAPVGTLMFGRIRQGLRPAVAHMAEGFGSHDPDGHLFLVGTAHKSAGHGHVQT